MKDQISQQNRDFQVASDKEKTIFKKESIRR